MTLRTSKLSLGNGSRVDDKQSSARSESDSSVTPALEHPPSESFGVRPIQRHKTSAGQVALAVADSTRFGGSVSKLGLNYAHTVWVSQGKLFAISGFRTEVLEVNQLAIKASRLRKTVSLTNPNHPGVTISPSGAPWKTFLECLTAAYPHVAVSPKVWSITNQTNDTCEFFER